MSLFRMENGWPVPQTGATELCQGLRWEQVGLSRLRTVNPTTGQEVTNNVIANFSMVDRLIVIGRLETIEKHYPHEMTKLTAFFGQSPTAKALVLAYGSHVVVAITTDYDHQRAVIAALEAEAGVRNLVTEARANAMASVLGD